MVMVIYGDAGDRGYVVVPLRATQRKSTFHPVHPLLPSAPWCHYTVASRGEC